MSAAARGEEACVYVVLARQVDRVKIGVATDARKRLRELQVGSPVELELADTRGYGDRREAVAVAEELYRYFATRRVRGSWYRLTVAEVREGFGRRATVEAPARAAAAAEAAAPDGGDAAPRRRQRRKRTEKQLAYERRRRQERAAKQRRAARLLTQMTQEEAAAAVGVTSRTLRNWTAAPAFRRENARQRKRAAHPRPLRS
jgi:DNA-binding transcriptional regulator YiaG